MLPITTLQEAISRGLTRYFTGRPCKRGHISQRNTITSACLACLAYYQRAHRQKLQQNRLMDSMGFVEVTARIRPEDRELHAQFVHLLNKWHLDPDGVDYIKLLSDYAQELWRASQLFVESS
jgi:hypothetical protein